MSNLTIISQNGGHYVDSREVADLIGKQHKHLLRDIRGYCDIIEKSNQPNFGLIDFFVESAFIDGRGRQQICYLLTKLGCEFCGNKLSGEKGILFTAAYVAKFNEFERQERDSTGKKYTYKLGEFNAASRLIVRALKNAGATSDIILDFLRAVYTPLGISVDKFERGESEKQRKYTASQIAELLGIYSTTGKPHNKAISCIINDYLFIDDCHKTVITSEFGFTTSVTVHYDDFVIENIGEWLMQADYPTEIVSDNGQTYHVVYPK